MERELAARAFDPALVLAVQAAIAASDALTIFHNGECSSSERHQDALSVFSRVTGVPDLDKARTRFGRILQEKGVIEYSGDPVRRDDADRIAEHTRRFIDFVAKHFPKK